MNEMEYYTTRLKCSDNDKLSCIKMVEKLHQMSQMARREGLLVLENVIENESDLFLQKSILMVVDAIDPVRIRKVLESYLVAGDYHGKEFLEKVLVIDAVLMIQHGENPLYLVQGLAAWFGLDFLPIYEKELQALIPKNAPPTMRRRRNEQSTPSTPFDEFAKLNDRSMQRLLRELNSWDIAAALDSANESTIQHFMSNMSKNMKDEVIQEMNNFHDYKIIAGKGAQARIEDYAKALEEQGELVFTDAMATFKNIQKND